MAPVLITYSFSVSEWRASGRGRGCIRKLLFLMVILIFLAHCFLLFLNVFPKSHIYISEFVRNFAFGNIELLTLLPILIWLLTMVLHILLRFFQKPTSIFWRFTGGQITIVFAVGDSCLRREPNNICIFLV